MLKETKKLSQIAVEYGVHLNVFKDGKTIALNGIPDVFEHRDAVTEAQAACERHLDKLYAAIDRLTTHVTFLKKSCRPNACCLPWLDKEKR